SADESCALTKGVKVSVPVLGALAWKDVAAGATITIHERGPTWTRATTPAGTGKIANTALRCAGATSAPPVVATTSAPPGTAAATASTAPASVPPAPTTPAPPAPATPAPPAPAA